MCFMKGIHAKISHPFTGKILTNFQLIKIRNEPGENHPGPISVLV